MNMPVSPEEIVVDKDLTVGALAQKLHVSPSEVIRSLFTMGDLVTIHQVVSRDAAMLVAENFGYAVKEIVLPKEGHITPSELAGRLHVSTSDVLRELFIQGVMATPNHPLDTFLAASIAEQLASRMICRKDRAQAFKDSQMGA
jgi:hypothetical protein